MVLTKQRDDFNPTLHYHLKKKKHASSTVYHKNKFMDYALLCFEFHIK